MVVVLELLKTLCLFSCFGVSSCLDNSCQEDSKLGNFTQIMSRVYIFDILSGKQMKTNWDDCDCLQHRNLLLTQLEFSIFMSDQIFTSQTLLLCQLVFDLPSNGSFNMRILSYSVVIVCSCDTHITKITMTSFALYSQYQIFPYY